MIDIPTIRRLLRTGHSVILVEQGQPPLVVTELCEDRPAMTEEEAAEAEAEAEEEVQISSRWPKGRSARDEQITPDAQSRSPGDARERQDQVLERLNSEILALKAQIAQEEEATGEVSGSN